ncbi:MAG: hypothetical protein F6J97_00965 [Leptolyngbya sp. SIO4C1]|nr:hypothetical protein [Leptolyngbya sp. SIO4C1]
MNSTDPRTLADIRAHVAVHYSAQQIAQTHNVAESTVRTRWFDWINQVAPAGLLKDERGYSELARTLFDEFAQVEKRDRKQWVLDAKSRYSQEWAGAGVIEGELMPEEVGNVLALRQTQTTDIELAVAQQLQSLEGLIDQVNAAEGNLSQADLKAAVARGQQRAVMLYQAELQAELQTTNALRQRRMGGNEVEP